MESNTVVDLGPENPETYTSSNLASFSWSPHNMNPEIGVLEIEFRESGEQYIYINVPEHLVQGLHARAMNPEDFDESVGQFFNNQIRDQFDRHGTEYQRITPDDAVAPF